MTFPGGVHPPDYKELTENCPIQPLPNPDQVAVLLSQHIGAICKPVVAKRDKVTIGQKIGEADAFVSAPVHSPVSGTVKDISLQSHPVLGRITGIIIETDKEDNVQKTPSADKFDKDFDETNFTPEQISDAVSNAGIVGMGGAGFPTHVKIDANAKPPKKAIIVNACECEPFLTCDYRVMLEWTWQFIAGIKLVRQITGCKNVYIGVEDNKPEAVKVLRQALSDAPGCEGIEVFAVKTKYPQGGEKQLIRSVLGEDVPLGGIPPMIGLLVINVATCCAIAEAAALKIPLTHRVCTVTGDGINSPCNYYVPIGVSVQEVIDHCGGLKDDASRVIMGGPMTGFAIADLSTPLTKTSGAITVLTQKAITKAKYNRQETPCIRCGRCLHVCPANINPTKIAHAVKYGHIDIAEKYHIGACIECGCCSYICPANIELKGYIRTGKILIARNKKKMPQ